MQKVYPFLWFNTQAETAAKFYVSVFKKAKMIEVNRDGKRVMSATFSIEGQEYIAFNGGPHFKFTPAVSFFVDCKNQKEVDYYWNALSKGGKKGNCGWLTDKFGISWQIIPSALGKLMGDEDEEKSERVMEAMLKMTKIDVEVLKKAHQGKR